MCFSSQASFIAAGSLLPAGAWAVRVCRSQRPELLPLALCPWLFAVQQALEGVVWLGLDGAVAAPLAHAAAVGFLFFAHGFWPAWMPWCALRAARPRRAEVLPLLRICCALGLLLGLWLWLPLLLDASRVVPEVVGGSINYQTRLLADGLVSHELGASSYALVVVMPLLLCGSRRLAWYGLALLASVVLSWIAFITVFTSVWCFLAAVLALMIPWVAAEPLGALGDGTAETGLA